MGLMAEPGNDFAEQMLALTERLATLIEAETVAVKTRKLSAAGADFEEKERLARVYRVEFNRIKQDPSLLEGARMELRDQLKDASKRLQDSLLTHNIALEAFKEISEGLVRTIAEEVANHRAAPQGYGGGGQSAPRSGATGVAVNVSG